LCKQCADQHDDERFNAFQPFFMLTWLSQEQAVLAQKYMQTGESATKTIHLEQEAINTEDEARTRMAEFQENPTVARFNVEKIVVCLN
jgi:uncharacterized membrane protein